MLRNEMGFKLNFFDPCTMRVWKLSFDFQFKIEMKIEKIVNFDFFLILNFEFYHQKQMFGYNFRLENKFEISNFHFSIFILK